MVSPRVRAEVKEKEMLFANRSKSKKPWPGRYVKGALKCGPRPVSRSSAGFIPRFVQQHLGYIALGVRTKIDFTSVEYQADGRSPAKLDREWRLATIFLAAAAPNQVKLQLPATGIGDFHPTVAGSRK